MPSNEAIELLESVLSESKNFRKYTKAMNDKISKDIDRIPDDATESYTNYAKYLFLNPEGRKIRKDISKATKDFKQRTGNKRYSDFNYINDKGEPDTKAVGYKSSAENYKKSIAKDVEKANARQRGKVVGGYKLEAAMILIEALNTLLNE